MNPLQAADQHHPFLGLAPFLRMSVDGSDVQAYVQSLLAQANQDQENAQIWMNLATGFLCLKMRDMGLAIQAQALSLQRTYHRAANCNPPRFRLLLIVTAGDLSENTPLDCLLEESPVELIYYYATVEQPLPVPLPGHDAVMVALSDSTENRPLLMRLQSELLHWPQPVINPPQRLPQVNRDRLSVLLQSIPGLQMPQTRQLTRTEVMQLAGAPVDTVFPLIIRPVGSQAGRDLEKITTPSALNAYLAQVESKVFYVAPFIDYSGADGQFRKCRITMVNGKPYISHMAISSHWMVHYVNAGMYASAEKRAEEARFMQTFPQFVSRHADALHAIYQRLKLDYFCIDCAEAPDGQLLIFEIDHIMVVHAMDSAALFPFKAGHIARIQQAFERYLFDLQPTALEYAS